MIRTLRNPLLAFLLAGTTLPAMAQVKIGDNPNNITPSAVLEANSTTKGFLPPRMTQAQQNAIVSPVEGLIIYCTDCMPASLKIYNGTAWVSLAGFNTNASFTANTFTCGGALTGTYQQGSAATAANTKTVSIVVAAGGNYSISTNTVNGVTFSGSGTTNTLGNNMLALTASGTPTAAGSFNYTINIPGQTSCTFSVTYLPADGIRAALASVGCASCARYDTAAVNTWVAVTSAEYESMLTLQSGDRYLNTNASFSGGAQGSGGLTFTSGHTGFPNSNFISGKETIPGSNYIVAFKLPTLGNATAAQFQTKYGQTANPSFVTDYLGLKTANFSTAGTYYFVAKLPTTNLLPASSSFQFALYRSDENVFINSLLSRYFGSGNANNLTLGNNVSITPYQVICTPVKQW